MPSDIRSFFGGGSSRPAEATEKTSTSASKPAKKQRGRKVVSDSSDEEAELTSNKTSKQEIKPKKAVAEPKVEETTSTDYFASNGKTKPLRSTPLRPKAGAPTNGTSAKTPTKGANTSAPSSGRRSVRKKASKNYAESDRDDIAAILKDDEGGGDDIYADDFKSNGRLAGDDYSEASGDDKVPESVTKSTRRGKGTSTKEVEPEFDDEDVQMGNVPALDGPGEPKGKRSSAKTTAKSGRKRKSKAVEDDEDESGEEDDEHGQKKKTKKSVASPASKKPRTATKTMEEKEESKEIQAIFDTIPTVRAPTPPPRDEKKKFTFGGGNTSVVPAGAGTKEIPVGAENCLAGLAFVFTGVLDTLGREEGQALVKRYGGKVTSGPSSKTSYVVLGNEAGPKKLETIAKLNLKTINEDGLFELIKRLPANGGDSLAAEKYAEKKAQEEKRIEEAAAEMDRNEVAAAKVAAKAKPHSSVAGSGNSASQTSNVKPVDGRLWTDKYAPDTMQAVVGNKGQVEKLQSWLRNWHKSAHYGFKKAGADGSGIYRAAMLHGPPGIGKTTAAHLIAKLEGYDIVETNASDTRSKKMVEDGLRGVLDTTSLLGFFAADGQKVPAAKKKLVLIMDEVDGMSAGDRGGVGALAAVAKKTNIPIILICNERRLPKMKSFDHITLDLPFRRPTVEQIRARIMTICYREGLKIPVPVLNALIEGTHADIRQIINMISTAKLDQQAMDFEDGKKMSKAWEKHVILKPWDIVSKILRPQMFAPSSTATLNDKIELYFNDHEFSYLMLQENYLKTQPARAANYSGKERNLKLLEIADNAAHSISNGDLVDRMIHGTQQQWSLMPTHAVFSFVDPASQVYGNFNERVGFASWLGQNSKYGKFFRGKLGRFVKEIQGHMRLRASGDRHEVRQQYLPALWNKTVRVLRDEGKEAVPSVIDLMDSYYLTKEDFDSMVELGVGTMCEENAKLETQTKATFTRLYNSQSHPVPFMKASNVVAPKAAKKAQPDLEEAVDESGEEDVLPEGEVKEDEGDDVDIKKDKYIKEPKKKAAPKTTGAKGKKRAKKEADEDGGLDASDSEEQPKKSKSAATKGGRKGKGKA